MSSEEPNYHCVNIKELKKLPVAKLLEYIYKYDTEVTHLSSELDKKSVKIQKILSEFNEIKDQMEFIQKNNHILSLELHATNKRSDKYKEQLQTAQTEINILKEELEESQSSSNIKKKYEQELKHKENTIEALKTDIAEHQHTIESKKKQMSELKEQVLYTKEENEILRNKQEMIEIETLSFKDNFNHKNKMLKAALKQSQQDLFASRDSASKLSERISELETQNTELKNELYQELIKSKYTQKCLEDQKVKSSIWEKKFQDLELRYNLQGKKSGQLLSKIKDLKILESQRNKAGDGNNNIQSVFEIKQKLNCIYRSFIGEICKTVENDTSIYLIESSLFYKIEKQLNELISVMQEKIEEHETIMPRKQERNFSSPYEKIISCVAPNTNINKRRNSLPK